MDTTQFDRLLKSLSEARVTPRRTIAGLFVSGVLGLASLAPGEARKKKRKRKSKRGGPTSQPAATCTDGVRNGTESDVDCGGSCPRCSEGRQCGSRQDCDTALCPNGSCQACTRENQCGGDEGGLCSCINGTCAGERGRTLVEDCAECPAGTGVCFRLDTFAFACLPPCGAAIP